MKSSLWIVFAVVAGFAGFLLGYSVPPIQETSSAGKSGEAVTTEETPVVDDAMSDYYKELQKLE